MTHDHTVAKLSFGEASTAVQEKSFECESCRSDGLKKTAVSYCDQCQQYMCGDCRIEHRKFKSTRNHDVTNLDVYQQRPLDDNQTVPTEEEISKLSIKAESSPEGTVSDMPSQAT